MRSHVDLFAGCGGLSLGLHRAGWEGLFAVEKDPMAFETLRQNQLVPGAPFPGFQHWPNWIPQEPLRAEWLLDGSENRRRLRALRGEVFLVSGGPPCQGFSVGGARIGSDQRNDLVHRLLEILGILEPPVVVIENVEGITRRFVSRPGFSDAAPADHVCAELRRLGYSVDYSVVDTSRFGVPQVRRRVLIIGFHRAAFASEDLAGLLPAALEEIRPKFLRQLGLPSDRAITVREALHDLAGRRHVPCPDSHGFLSGTYVSARSAYAKIMRIGVSKGDIPNSHRFSHHGERIAEIYRSAHKTQPSGRLPKSFLLSWGTKKDKKVLLDPERPASTITTHPDEFIHYTEPRNISVREMARLQSFPDQFFFFGRYTINGPRRRFDVARCSQVGNAVPPFLAQAVGLAIHRIVDAALGLAPPLSHRASLHKEPPQMELFQP
jgi:DNA (cytosine-5)-methyltransferase 1